MKLVQFIARNWPFANGAGRFVDKYAKAITFGSGERLVKTSDGFSINVLADDLIGRHIIIIGSFDRSIVQILLDHARVGDTLLDIGANIGYVSACFLANVDGGNVVCVEPQPGIVDLLRKNMLQFSDRARVEQVALSDEPGELRFHVDHANRGASRISADGETVVQAVDAALVLRELPKLDLIKIDVEGYEEPVFRAIEGELKRLKPRAILFEDQTGAAAPQGAIGAILSRVGYKLYGIDKRLFRTMLVPIHTQADSVFNDYLAVL